MWIPRFDPWVRKIPCRRDWLPTLVLLPGEFHGHRGYCHVQYYHCELLALCRRIYVGTPANSAAAAAAAKLLESCLTLCNPIDGSPSGTPVPGILQARTLEWVAISFSNA